MPFRLISQHHEQNSKARGKFAPVYEIWGDIKKCFFEVLQF